MSYRNHRTIVVNKSGRGPSGKLRNYKAMTNSKLGDLYRTVSREKNDQEAYEAIEFELILRGFKIDPTLNPFLEDNR